MALTREERLKLADIDPELAEVRIQPYSLASRIRMALTYNPSDPQKNHHTCPRPQC